MATAIGRFSFVPNRALSTSEQIGVVAVAKGGITRVDFSINGGGTISVSTLTKVEDTDVNGNPTVHYEYQTTFDPSSYSDGLVTIDATIVGTTTTNRVLTQVNLVANSGGTHNPSTVYVATTGNDTTGDGTSGTPYLTVMKALADTSNVGGDIIEIMDEGTFNMDTSLSVSRFLLNEWTTIRGASGLNKNNVIISRSTRGLLRPKCDRIKWEHCVIDVALVSQIYGENSTYGADPRDGDVFWIHDSGFINSNGWTDNPGSITYPFRQRPATDGAYATNCESNDTVYGFPDLLMTKGCHVEKCSGDAYQNSQFLLNCTANNVDATIRTAIDAWHTDVLQMFGTHENTICYNLQVTNANECQLLFFDKTNSTFNNCAVINYGAEAVVVTAEASQFASVNNHVLIWNVSLPNQRVIFRDDFIGAEQFQPTDFEVKNCVFKDLDNQSGVPTILPGVVADTNHIVDGASWGINNTSGAVLLEGTDSSEGDFTYTGTDVADITDSGLDLGVPFPDWDFGSDTNPNIGAWPQSAWVEGVDVLSVIYGKNGTPSGTPVYGLGGTESGSKVYTL